MNNRLWNAKNPHQGSALKVLCVCSAGLLRSPTVAHIMATKGYNTRAVGLDNDFALIPLDDVLLTWADEVVCMNYSQAEDIVQRFDGEIYNFNIQDDYAYMQPELVSIVEERLENLQNYKFY